MAIIGLHIHDSIQLITLKTMLESEGHTVHRDATHTDAQVLFIDLAALNEVDSKQTPIIVIASLSQIPDALTAMHAGVWGYILTPFQPKEATLTIDRVLQGNNTIAAVPTLDTLPTMEAVELEHIQRALRLCNGNQAKAARVLKIGRNTLWRKMKKMQDQNPHG